MTDASGSRRASTSSQVGPRSGAPQTPRRVSVASSISIASPASFSGISTTSAASFASAVSGHSCISAVPAPAATETETQTEWHVSSPTATTAIGGRVSRGHATTEGNAEQELSSLYATSERERAKAREDRRKSWGGRVVSSAVNATVFGAAIGLTAYRIWNEGWGAIASPARAEGEADYEAEDDDEEGDKGDDDQDDGGNVAEVGNEHERSCSTPPHSLGTRRTPHSQHTQPRSRHTRSPLTPRRLRRPRTQRPTIADLVALSTQPSASVQSPPQPSERSLRSLSPYSDDSDDEWNARLESMARRVQSLITEGQRALSSPSSSPHASISSTYHSRPSLPERIPQLEVESQPGPEELLLSSSLQRHPSPPLGKPFPRRDSNASATSSSYTGDYHPMNRKASMSSDIGLGRPSYRRSESTRTVSASSSISARGRYTQVIPPLPWRRESAGTSPRWVQRPLTPSTSGRTTPPQTSTPNPASPARHQHSGSKIPRPGSHSRNSSIHDSPGPRRRASSGISRGIPTPPPGMPKSISVSSGLVASRASMFAEREKSRIPVRRSIGSISSIKAVVE